jgi:hypothetical protein
MPTEERTVSDIHSSNNRSTNVDVQGLTEETIKLLRMSLDALYATLGGQLLGTAVPSKVAGIVSYLAALRAGSEAKAMHGDLPAIFSLEDLSRGFATIGEELRREGMRYVSGMEDELRKTLNNEDLFQLSEETSPSHVQVILMVVAAVLRLPRYLDAISVTVTAILLKQGLQNFCQGKTQQ